jgi:hypothetical protein
MGALNSREDAITSGSSNKSNKKFNSNFNGGKGGGKKIAVPSNPYLSSSK